MTMPAFVSKGTAATPSYDSCIGAFDFFVTLPGTINAGDIIVIAAFAGVIGANFFDGVGSPPGYTTIYQDTMGANRLAGIYYKVAAGFEDSSNVNLTYYASGGGSAVAQAYVFSGSGTGGVDTSSGGFSSGTSSSATLTSLTTNAANSLAVGFVFANSSGAISSATGETGGDWVEAVAEDVSGNFEISLQTAQMASIGTISGGAVSLASSVGWKTFTFMLEEVGGAAASAPPPRDPLRPFQHLLIR